MKFSSEVDYANGIIENGIAISSPGDGSAFESGGSVVVEVDSVAPFNAQRVLLLSEFAVMESDMPPFVFTIDIPLDYSGYFDVSAMAKDSSGDLSDAGTIEIFVAPAAELLELSISPEYAFLNGINDHRQIAVFGEYSDGVERDG
jgi:hypothetical protein